MAVTCHNRLIKHQEQPIADIKGAQPPEEVEMAQAFLLHNLHIDGLLLFNTNNNWPDLTLSSPWLHLVGELPLPGLTPIGGVSAPARRCLNHTSL